MKVDANFLNCLLKSELDPSRIVLPLFSAAITLLVSLSNDEGECGEHAKEKIKVPNCNFSVFGLVATLATLAAGNEVYDSLDIGFSI